jgi:hypothetical protein
LQEYADETAYYLNGRLRQIALVAKGVRFPAGRWIRMAGEVVPPWHVQELVSDLFPSLASTPVPLAILLTDFDVEEFERQLALAPPAAPH